MSARYLRLVHTSTETIPAGRVGRMGLAIDTRVLDILLAVYFLLGLGIGVLLGWALFS